MSHAKDRPSILVTNDDGIEAAGLLALVEAAETVGRVTVVAPDRERSAAGHSLTLERPLRVVQTAERRYRVDGTPTDCVHLAVGNITGDRPPALVLSGINRGLNSGDDVTYSGTVAAAIEGTLLHIPSVAFSVDIDAQGRAEFDGPARFAARLTREVLRRGLPAGTLLNVNFPANTPRGVRITRQGTRTYRATSVVRRDPSGRPYYWIAGADTRPTGEPDGDHAALSEGYISISPLRTNMTDDPSVEDLKRWALELD